jgi:hypothetical protein
VHEVPGDESGAVFGCEQLGQRAAVQLVGHDVEQRD